MSPVDGGFVRLDRETGAMSICRKTDESWSCSAMDDADQDALKEIDRLKAENQDLKDEIRRMEGVFGLDGQRPAPGGPGRPLPDIGGGPPGGPLGGPPGGLPKFDLPSEKDVDRAIDYLEGMIRKFRERFEDFGDKTDPNRPNSRRGDRSQRDEDRGPPQQQDDIPRRL